VVKIRLKRMGATKRPFYRLVVADSRSPRDGKFIEEIGTYDPLPDPAVIEIDADKVRAWLKKGAQPSDPARSLLEREGILPQRARPTKPAKPKAEPVAESSAAAAAAPVAEPPVAEEPAAEEAPAEAEQTETSPEVAEAAAEPAEA